MEIDKAIQNLCKGKTVIVVAHRLSALKMCNRVAVVENHTITSVVPMRKFGRTTPTIEKRGMTTKQPGISLIIGGR